MFICQGTTYVYDSFFRPYLAKHENEIDRNLLELRTRAGDFVVLYWQRAASYGQTRIFDILQYVAAQSTPGPRPPQVRHHEYDFHYLMPVIMHYPFIILFLILSLPITIELVFVKHLKNIMTNSFYIA